MRSLLTLTALCAAVLVLPLSASLVIPAGAAHAQLVMDESTMTGDTDTTTDTTATYEGDFDEIMAGGKKQKTCSYIKGGMIVTAGNFPAKTCAAECAKLAAAAGGTSPTCN